MNNSLADNFCAGKRADKTFHQMLNGLHTILSSKKKILEASTRTSVRVPSASEASNIFTDHIFQEGGDKGSGTMVPEEGWYGTTLCKCGGTWYQR